MKTIVWLTCLVLLCTTIYFYYYSQTAIVSGGASISSESPEHEVEKEVAYKGSGGSHGAEALMIFKRWPARTTPPPLQSSGCNEITSSPILTVDESGRMRQACRCHWPSLFGQKHLFTDCNVRHACDGGKGELVHRVTRRPLTEAEPPFDIHDYECSSCDRCNSPGPDQHTGLPSCLPRTFNDRDRDMCLYGTHSEADVHGLDYSHAGAGNNSVGVANNSHSAKEDYRTTKPMLSAKSRFVDSAYIAMFTDRARTSAWLPNPCAFDLFNGALLDGDCELRMTRKSNIAYCAPTRDNVVTAVKDDTYLSNNRGIYPNACFRFTSNEEHVKGYVIEYFLRQRKSGPLPSPVVSMCVDKKYVLNTVLKGLGLTRQPDEKVLLFTQPEPPADVVEFPHPFNVRRMSQFKKELNNWIDRLPTKCTAFSPYTIRYSCSAPVQPLVIPKCSMVGKYDRNPLKELRGSSGGLFSGLTEEYAKTTLTCTGPTYDTRFPLVPNYNVTEESINADPPSTVLFFNKTDMTVYPHWKDFTPDEAPGHLVEIQRYVREDLRSLPNERRN